MRIGGVRFHSRPLISLRTFIYFVIFVIRVVGTQNAHNLISVSTDGRLCSWSLDMLSAPQELLELQVITDIMS